MVGPYLLPSIELINRTDTLGFYALTADRETMCNHPIQPIKSDTPYPRPKVNPTSSCPEIGLEDITTCRSITTKGKCPPAVVQTPQVPSHQRWGCRGTGAGGLRAALTGSCGRPAAVGLPGSWLRLRGGQPAPKGLTTGPVTAAASGLQ